MLCPTTQRSRPIGRPLGQQSAPRSHHGPAPPRASHLQRGDHRHGPARRPASPRASTPSPRRWLSRPTQRATPPQPDRLPTRAPRSLRPRRLVDQPASRTSGGRPPSPRPRHRVGVPRPAPVRPGLETGDRRHCFQPRAAPRSSASLRLGCSAGCHRHVLLVRRHPARRRVTRRVVRPHRPSHPQRASVGHGRVGVL